MVTVYRISSDYSGPVLAAADPKFFIWEAALKLERVRPTWQKSIFYIQNPVQAKDTDFYDVHIGTLAFGKRVYEGILGEIVERCGEVLPAVREDTREEFYILNPLACYNCLNRDKTKLETTPDGKTVTQIHEYSFYSERIGGESIFKIPETYRSRLLASSGRIAPEDEFFHQYHEGGYTGLKFEKLWSGSK